jgi:hypothetical protein
VAGRGAAVLLVPGGSRALSPSPSPFTKRLVEIAAPASPPDSSLAASSSSVILTGLSSCVEDPSTAIDPARRLGRARAGSLLRDTGNTRCSTPADPWPSTLRKPEIHERLAGFHP